MSLLQLSILIIALSVCIGLVLTNPTMDHYLGFLEAELQKAMDRSEQTPASREQAVVRSIFRLHSHELLSSVVRPHTVRRDWGILSVYETTVFESRILVLGVAGRFIPLHGLDETILRLGRLAF